MYRKQLIQGNDILINGFDYSEEYEPTNLNLTIKPEDYK